MSKNYIYFRGKNLCIVCALCIWKIPESRVKGKVPLKFHIGYSPHTDREFISLGTGHLLEGGGGWAGANGVGLIPLCAPENGGAV